jgi:putative flavoprotein involved in K+ transport
MNMLGRLARVDNSRARFADDLGASVAFGDARWAELRQLLRAQLTAHGMNRPGTARTSVVRVHTARGDWPS